MVGWSLVQEWSDDSARSQHPAWKYPDGHTSDSDRKSIGHKTSDKSKYGFVLSILKAKHIHTHSISLSNTERPYHRFVIDVSCFPRLVSFIGATLVLLLAGDAFCIVTSEVSADPAKSKMRNSSG
jgi:hypothetical protein